MNRANRKSIAEHTLDILDQGRYQCVSKEEVVISDALAAAIAGVQIWTPSRLADLLEQPRAAGGRRTVLEVRNETTLAAARRLVTEQALPGVLCLNFASAKNPGGGFLGGSQAQEESLARSSALYSTLNAAPLYYEVNRGCGSGTALYTDHMILSPKVPVFRDDDGLLLAEPFEVGFVTAPAVNAGAVSRNEPGRTNEIAPTMRRRIAMLLALAENEGYRHLVLGAWGCGVFRNDPLEIAGLFGEQLLENGDFSGSFDSVIFSVLDQPNGPVVGAFERVFSKNVVS